MSFATQPVNLQQVVFCYRGVLNSNCDLHIDHDKPADMPMAYGANNHGSIVEINGDWYIFYHRHTNGTWYSRQGCAEKLHMNEDGSFAQAELTSCGLNGGPLPGKGVYPAYIACRLFTDQPVYLCRWRPVSKSNAGWKRRRPGAGIYSEYQGIHNHWIQIL